MWFAKLIAHLQPQIEPVAVNSADGEKVTIAANSDKIGPIKAVQLGQLKEKYFLKLLHVAATYLDPLQNNRLFDCDFTQELIDHDLLYLKDIMLKVGHPSKWRCPSLVTSVHYWQEKPRQEAAHYLCPCWPKSR
ncbi:unnamed protein product [Sphagnum tenellum]